MTTQSLDIIINISKYVNNIIGHYLVVVVDKQGRQLYNKRITSEHIGYHSGIEKIGVPFIPEMISHYSVFPFDLTINKYLEEESFRITQSEDNPTKECLPCAEKAKSQNGEITILNTVGNAGYSNSNKQL